MSAARSSAQAKATATMSLVESVGAQVLDSYSSLKKNGLKTWGVDLVRSARQVVGSNVSALRARTIRSVSDVAVGLQNNAKAARDVAGLRALALKKRAGGAVTDIRERAKAGADFAQGKAQDLKKKTGEVVSQKSFQATAASSMSGAVVVGTGAGVSGLVAGGCAGAVAGLPFALFTFGMSVPLGAALGGSAGLVTGAAAGATAGAVGGGAVGYGTYAKWDDISAAGKSVAGKACDGRDNVKAAASRSLDYARAAASAARARITGADTGSTPNMD